jgi:hypothetical protein
MPLSECPLLGRGWTSSDYQIARSSLRRSGERVTQLRGKLAHVLAQHRVVWSYLYAIAALAGPASGTTSVARKPT